MADLDLPKLGLSEKLGNIPVAVWGVILAVGGLAVYMMMRKTGSGAPAARTSSLDPSGYQTSGITGGSAVDPTVVDAAPADNNQSWLTRVSRQTSDKLAASPSGVYAALQAWLYGEQITPDQQKIVDTALQNSGNPPEGTQGISSVVAPPAPTPKPTPKPVTPTKPAPVNPHPFGPGVVVSTSAAAAQWYVAPNGKRREISQGESRALRAAGSQYAVQRITKTQLAKIPRG